MNHKSNVSRRSFVKSAATTSVAAGVGLSGQPGAAAGGYHHSTNDTLKVGLVGCGGRGTQAVFNALNADPNTIVTALADAFKDRVASCHENLMGNEKYKGRVKIPREQWFDGFDCCELLVDSDVDVIILATPPYFRPSHLSLAVDAGKHVFCEKPVAVDPPGVRQVMAACDRAAEKGLSIVSGLCWRYDIGVNAIMDKILNENALGEIRTIQENYLTGTLWHRGNKPNWSQMEYQMRNWLYFNWLSGDHIAEQHIHSLDKAMWLMGDEPPETAYGSGGRQVRTNEKWGNIYDHFSTVFEWKNGTKMFSYCRQMSGCMNDVDDYVIGTKASAKILRKQISDSTGVIWKFGKKRTPSMYDVEHEHLFRSIRDGKPINDGNYMSQSTLLAIMGREACYTGKKIKWDELFASETKLGPEKLEFGDYTPGKVPMPGSGW